MVFANILKARGRGTDELCNCAHDGNTHGVIELLKHDGSNPLKDPNPLNGTKSAFQVASERRDLRMMLHMIASDDDRDAEKWTRKAFFLSTGKLEMIPSLARPGVASASSIAGAFFHFGGASAMGFEVMTTYGYRLKELDIEAAIALGDFTAAKCGIVLHGKRPEGSLEGISTARMVARVMDWIRENPSLEEHQVESANDFLRILLQTGADPNDWTVCDPPHDFYPCLWIAAHGNQLDIARILLAHGADPMLKARMCGWNGQVWVVVDQSAAELATSLGFVEMAQLLSDAEKAGAIEFSADIDSAVEECRCSLMPLRNIGLKSVILAKPPRQALGPVPSNLN